MRIVDPPAVAAVSLADLKGRARVSHDHEDHALQLMLDSAIRVVETGAHRPLTPRRMVFPVPVGLTVWWFPVCPIRSLSALRGRGASGAWEEVTGARLISDYEEPRLILPRGGLSSAYDEIEVEAEVGHDLDDPQASALKDAILMLASDREWNRGVMADASAQRPVPFHTDRLIRQMRYQRPFLGVGRGGEVRR